MIQIDNKIIAKIIKKTIAKHMEVDAKVVPKWRLIRCQKSSKINAKTDNETKHDNHQKSYLSDV